MNRIFHHMDQESLIQHFESLWNRTKKLAGKKVLQYFLLSYSKRLKLLLGSFFSVVEQQQKLCNNNVRNRKQKLKKTWFCQFEGRLESETLDWSVLLLLRGDAHTMYHGLSSSSNSVGSTNMRGEQLFVSVIYDFEYISEEGKRVFMKENEILLLINKTNHDWWQVIMSIRIKDLTLVILRQDTRLSSSRIPIIL